MNTLPRDMIRPRALAPGARVALVAPAGPLDGDRLELGAERCRMLGLEPVLFPSAGARSGFLAGSDAERLGDLQAAFDDPSVDGVWALRGGYGTLRILDDLNLERQRRDPIPFIGFSDNTTVHVRQNRFGIVSIHGPHPAGPFPAPTEAWFRTVLFGRSVPGPLPRGPDDPPSATLVEGTVEAPLFGGNLSMLASLCGSSDSMSASGRILFLEDVGEPAYRLDRMLVQLQRAGVTEGVVGLALGRFTPPSGEDETDCMDVLETFARELGVPAVAGLPFGHVKHNCALPVGGAALLDGRTATLSLTRPAVVV